MRNCSQELFLSDPSPIIAPSYHSVTDIVEKRLDDSLVDIFKLDFGQDYEIEVWLRFQSWSLVEIWKLDIAFEDAVWSIFESEVLSIFWSWIFILKVL